MACDVDENARATPSWKTPGCHGRVPVGGRRVRSRQRNDAARDADTCARLDRCTYCRSSALAVVGIARRRSSARIASGRSVVRRASSVGDFGKSLLQGCAADPRQQPGVRRGCGGVRKLGTGRETPVAINLRPLGLQQKHQERIAENGDIPDLIAFVEERFLRPDQCPAASLGLQRLNGLFLGLRKTRRVAFTFQASGESRRVDAVTERTTREGEDNSRSMGVLPLVWNRSRPCRVRDSRAAARVRLLHSLQGTDRTERMRERALPRA